MKELQVHVHAKIWSIWMLSNFPEPQVNFLPKIRWSNQASQVRQFFLRQAIQILLNLSNLLSIVNI
jgi:hypothetical protein